MHQAPGAELIVDALLGTGFKPPLRSLAAKVGAAINEAAAIVVAVDVPSGVDADGPAPVRGTGGNMIFAHGVIALIAPKPAHAFGRPAPPHGHDVTRPLARRLRRYPYIGALVGLIILMRVIGGGCQAARASASASVMPRELEPGPVMGWFCLPDQPDRP
jgi:hypothetical protein